MRSSCVGPSPPETTQRSALEALRERGRELVRARRRRSRSAPARARARAACAARNGPFRSVRSPRTSSLPVTTMTARGRLKRASGRRAPDLRDGDDARPEPRAQPPGLAVHDQPQVLGRGGEDPDRARDEPLRLALLERALEEQPARRGAARAPGARSCRAIALEDDDRRWPATVGVVAVEVAAGGPRFGIVAVPDEPPNFHAAITSAVITPIAHERDDHDVRLDAAGAPLAAAPSAARRGAKRRLLLAGDEARVVLVDVELAVEARGSRRTCAGSP